MRSRYLIPQIEAPRVRRAADATGVVIASGVLAWSWWRYGSVSDPDAAIAELTAWIPDWLNGVLAIAYGFGSLYALVLLVAILTQWRTRRDVVRDVLLAVAATVLLVVLVVRIVNGAWPSVLPELGLADPSAQFPMLRVAMIASLVAALAPHLTRPTKRLAWTVLVIDAIAGVGLGFGLPASAFGAVALGAIAAGAVLVTFGSPRGYPDFASIEEALGSAGLEVTNLRLDDDQSWGVRRLLADSAEHDRVEIKAYGRDATDSQLFARTWRYLWYRDTEPTLMLTRMQSVEHEALVTVMAARTSAAVPSVLAAGVGGDDVAVLAVSRSGTRLSHLDPGQVSDEVLAAVWGSIAAIHRASISHGGLNADAITLSDAGHQVGDFAFGSLAASPSFRALDVVELLFSMSLLVGVERAVASAADGLGTETMAEVLPFIQTPAVSTQAKRRADKPKALLEEIRDEASRVTGVVVEEPAEIRRVKPRNIVMAGLTAFAAYFLISQLSGIDFVAVGEVLQVANWALIVIAFFVAQLMYFPEATAMLAAVGQPIPLRPAMVLQSAINFITLAVPSTAGRVGMIAAFLRKYGISFTASLVQGSIDTLSGLAVEVVILLTAFLLGDLALDTSGGGDSEWGWIILVLLVVAAGAVIAFRRVQRVRDWLMPIVGEAIGALGGVLKDPKRATILLISNFGSRFVLAVAMWLILHAIGAPLGLWSVLTATVATGLLGGIVPVPGGVGVAEAILAAFLVMFGVDETSAFAAAVVYRMVSFYIPAAAGYLSMRWLEKNGYV